MVYERVDLLNAFKAIRFNEKPKLALIGALVLGVLPTTLFIALMTEYPYVNLFISTIVFPTIVAVFCRFVAKLYTMGAKLPVTLMVGLAHVVLGIVFQPGMPWFLLTPVPLAIVYLASDIKLSRLEIYAVDEHIIRPFTIEIPSHSNLIYVPAVFTVVFAVACHLLQVRMNLSCLSYIEEEHHSAILVKCVLYDGDINDPYTKKVHQFGSYLEPSQEAILIKTKAESGNSEFQYVWWFILDKIYRNEFSFAQGVGRERFESKVDSWLNSAAAGGSADAKIEYLAQHFDRTLSSLHQKELALKFAKELDAMGVSDAKKYLEMAGNKITRQDVLTLYIFQLQNLDSLSQDELENLLKALEEGKYFYDLKDFGKTAPYSTNGRNSIEVPIDMEKASKVRKIIAEKY